MRIKKLYTFFILLLFGGEFFAQQDSINYSAPKTYFIGGIQPKGNNFTDANIIRLLSGLLQGDKITVPGDKITDAIKALWKQGLFENIKIYQEKVIGKDVFLIIEVVERPRLSKFIFTGDKVKKSDADDIRNKIRLIREKVVTDYSLGFVKNIVRDFYVNKGYYNTNVTITSEPDRLAKTPHVILNINVDKGDKVRIQNLIFHGNTLISNGKLRRKMKDSKPYRKINIFNSGKYLEDNVAKDLPNIIEKYNTKGYRDARIVKDTAYFVKKNRVNLEVYIDEGHKFYFGKFKWFGNTKYRSGQLDSLVNIKAGDMYNQSALEQKLFMNPNGLDVTSLYMDDGYLFFQVTPQESNIHNDTIDFDIHMHEGNQATINKVTVKGNDKTNDHVIYRELRTRPGQLFRRADIMRSQRQLSMLGYFDPEKMGVQPTPNPADGTVDIEYTVAEKPNDQITLSGGWGGGRVIGTLGVTFNNFSTRNFFKKESWKPLPTGDGQRLSISAQTNGVYYQSYNLSFTEPWLGGKKPNSLTVSAFHSAFSNGVKKLMKDPITNDKVYNPLTSSMDIWGGSVGFGKQMKWPDDFFSLYASANYNYYELYKYTYFILPTGFANDFNISANVSRNSIDQQTFPRSGANIVFRGQWTPPYSMFNNKDYKDLTLAQRYRFLEYQKYKFTAEWFTQLTNKRAAEGKESRNLVLRTKIGFGFLGWYNKDVGISPFERFYLGGSGLSGFQNFVAREIIALRGYQDNSLSSAQGDPICSRYTMELRYPITLNPQAMIFVLGFAEAGNSWSTYKNYNPFQVKRSAGVGLRIFLPMFGLLGLDYGWNFDTGPSDPQLYKGHFHFTIGAQLGEL